MSNNYKEKVLSSITPSVPSEYRIKSLDSLLGGNDSRDMRQYMSESTE